MARWVTTTPRATDHQTDRRRRHGGGVVRHCGHCPGTRARRVPRPSGSVPIASSSARRCSGSRSHSPVRPLAEVTAAVRTHWRLMLVGGLGVAIYTPAFLVAVDRTGVAVGTVVAVGVGPFFAGAMEWWWRSVRPSRGWFLGTVVTVAGGALLVVEQVDRVVVDRRGRRHRAAPGPRCGSRLRAVFGHRQVDDERRSSSDVGAGRAVHGRCDRGGTPRRTRTIRMDHHRRRCR